MKNKKGLRPDGKLKKGCRFVGGGKVECKSPQGDKTKRRGARPKGGGTCTVSRRRATSPHTGKIYKGCRRTKNGRYKCPRRVLGATARSFRRGSSS